MAQGKGQGMNRKTLIAALQTAYDSALAVYRTDRESGADGIAIAFDAGRVDGLKQALELVLREPEHR
jgi:hypothetical protein